MDGAGRLELKKVETKDMPKLYTWLTDHLPETWKLWSSVREAMSGTWPGMTFYVLGWPDNIVAVGEGPLEDTCPAYNYYTTPRSVCAFGISQLHVKTLLTWPGYMDFTESFILLVAPTIVSQVVLENWTSPSSVPIRGPCSLMVASPGDVELVPVPDGLTLEPLDPDLHTDLVDASWKYRRDFSGEYVRALIRKFPSVGLFNGDGKLLAFELGTEYGTLGFLYVTPEARGQGLSKVITSHLAHKMFSENLPAAVTVENENKLSLKLHESLGFKVKCQLDMLYHVPTLK